jgi:hypothetical protein
MIKCRLMHRISHENKAGQQMPRRTHEKRCRFLALSFLMGARIPSKNRDSSPICTLFRPAGRLQSGDGSILHECASLPIGRFCGLTTRAASTELHAPTLGQKPHLAPDSTGILRYCRVVRCWICNWSSKCQNGIKCLASLIVVVSGGSELTRLTPLNRINRHPTWSDTSSPSSAASLR